MVAEWTGTVLCARNSRTELRPRRSSNQPALTCSVSVVLAMACSGPLGDDHFVAAHLDGVFLQRRRWRSGDHLPVEVVDAVMAGAPDLLGGVAELDGAVEV